jgi:hypothetical protein
MPFMRRPLGTIFLAAMIAALAGPAYSQKKTDADLILDKKRQQEIDSDYKATLERMKGRQGPAPAADPWGGVREAGPSEKKAKAAVPLTKGPP